MRNISAMEDGRQIIRELLEDTMRLKLEKGQGENLDMFPQARTVFANARTETSSLKLKREGDSRRSPTQDETKELKKQIEQSYKVWREAPKGETERRVAHYTLLSHTFGENKEKEEKIHEAYVKTHDEQLDMDTLFFTTPFGD